MEEERVKERDGVRETHTEGRAERLKERKRKEKLKIKKKRERKKGKQKINGYALLSYHFLQTGTFCLINAIHRPKHHPIWICPIVGSLSPSYLSDHHHYHHFHHLLLLLLLLLLLPLLHLFTISSIIIISLSSSPSSFACGISEEPFSSPCRVPYRQTVARITLS